MDWMTNWITREGPGIRKDEPRKTGLALFGSIIFREAWELFKLNLLMLLLAIPLITIPASFAAACHITTRMIDDEVVFLWRDFWRAFVRLFFKATGLGLGLGVAGGICCYAAYIYGQMALQTMLYIAPAALAVAIALFLLMAAVGAFTLLARFDLPLGMLMRCGFLTALARPLPILAGVLFAVSLWGAHILFYPASIFMPVILNFSLGTLAMTFSAFKATDFALGLVEPTGSRPDVDHPAS
ncbi:Uncharacterized membrane protein YesL [Cohaesibacter sp. ES.047]|uniref:DUF624 domain-containing protein n=1 Tax=Cohaesibacter sp. ES.047 TaxID=1798205 RepID=UPI000BB8DF9F|nr:DUF624 domain-containing protein [Cohaesibacter sp. ES.047]SNY90218.1 Uncharacterized membrane protein YesL [Cohaesibacter sp. ES.047]